MWKQGSTDFRHKIYNQVLKGLSSRQTIINKNTLLAIFFSRTCLSTYFIKREADYKHNLMLAKQELTGTSTQRSNNKEKIEKRPTKTNSHSTSRTTTTEQRTSPTRQDPRNNLTQMNLHKEQHHRGRQQTTNTTNGWPSIHQNKQLHSGESTARDDQSAAQTRWQIIHLRVTRAAKYPPDRARYGRQSIRHHNDGKASVKVAVA